MKKWGGISKSGCEFLFLCSLNVRSELRQSVGMQGYVGWPLTFIYLEWFIIGWRLLCGKTAN